MLGSLEVCRFVLVDLEKCQKEWFDSKRLPYKYVSVTLSYFWLSQRVMMQIVQELCKRPGLNKCGFDMPTIYIPNPNKVRVHFHVNFPFAYEISCISLIWTDFSFVCVFVAVCSLAAVSTRLKKFVEPSRRPLTKLFRILSTLWRGTVNSSVKPLQILFILTGEKQRLSHSLNVFFSDLLHL